MKEFVRVKEFMAENKQGLGLWNTIWELAIRNILLITSLSTAVKEVIPCEICMIFARLWPLLTGKPKLSQTPCSQIS